VALADSALLSAKVGGRNQVMTSNGTDQPAPVRVRLDATVHSNGDSFDVVAREPQPS